MNHNLSEVDWAYLAGFMDGEACISANGTSSRPNNKASVRISISQCDHRQIEYLGNKFGVGNLDVEVARNRLHTKARWRILKQADIEFILSGVLPYLILKRKQARVALFMIRNTKSLTVRQNRHLAQKLRDLKLDGFMENPDIKEVMPGESQS